MVILTNYLRGRFAPALLLILFSKNASNVGDKCLMDNDNTNISEKIKVRHGDNINNYFPSLKCDSNKEKFDVKENANIEKCEFDYVVKLKNGMHARPAGKIVGIVKDNNAIVTIEANGKLASGDSITSIIALGVVNGTNVKVSVESKNVEWVSQKIKKYLSEEE